MTCATCGQPQPDFQPIMRLDDLHGHLNVKRAFEIAQVGDHTVAVFSRGNREDADVLAAWYARHAQPKTILVVAHCPCGNFGSVHHQCTCSAKEVRTHQRKRAFQNAMFADIHIQVTKPGMRDQRKGESDEIILGRVAEARQQPTPTALDEGAQSLLRAAQRQKIASEVRLLVWQRVAATITRLEVYRPRTLISAVGMAEAIQYTIPSDNL